MTCIMTDTSAVDDLKFGMKNLLAFNNVIHNNNKWIYLLVLICHLWVQQWSGPLYGNMGALFYPLIQYWHQGWLHIIISLFWIQLQMVGLWHWPSLQIGITIFQVNICNKRWIIKILKTSSFVFKTQIKFH